MFSGPPLPLSVELPLQWLCGQLRPPAVLGAWVREPVHPLEIQCCSRGRVLVSADLGLLLGRCSQVALRERSEPVVLETELLIQWRALQVVTATPYLPDLTRLSEIVQAAHLDPTGFRVPLATRSPEEVLAECLEYGIPVAGSRIVYGRWEAAAPSG